MNILTFCLPRIVDLLLCYCLISLQSFSETIVIVSCFLLFLSRGRSVQMKANNEFAQILTRHNENMMKCCSVNLSCQLTQMILLRDLNCFLKCAFAFYNN